MPLPKDSGVGETFTWTPIPITHAFALSDHKVQGKGLAKSIWDLQKPLTRHFALENYYTMLSWTSDWEDMAILWPFKDDIFSAKPDKRLVEYDMYLERQNERTVRLYEQEMQIA